MLPLIAASAAAAVVAGLVWGVLEARAFVVRHVDVPVLPPGAAPVTVLHVSDLHLVPSQRAKLAWVRSIAALRPDLVVNTGDNIGSPAAIVPLRDALGPLLAAPGVFVFGSNDYVAPHWKNPFTYFRGPTRPPRRPVALPTAELAAALGSRGWVDLNNARTELDVGGVRFVLVGLDDPHIGRDSLPSPSRAAARADVTIGVVHAPYSRALAALAEEGAELILAGHTHGGQVRIPGIGALVTNCDLDRHKARGLSGWPGARPDADRGSGSVWLHVSAGAGTSPYARIRFSCRPEATLLRLVPPGASPVAAGTR